ncbi:hypothetical protein [Paraflavitalea speifideaquila]|uniref:hypothetical protein n=1 Tax=Paraflavitalea speifideaquila TaxID=3076558 RepID=UPI0028EEF5F7|nr:hypothetical protein [Paraflavitalea speifideiaquila]
MKHLLILCAVAAFAVSGQSNRAAAVPETNKTVAQAAFNGYTWYTDMDLENPTGTFGSIGSELARLRSLHPGYVFSSSFSLGLQEFEYGYSPYYFTHVIFSDY